MLGAINVANREVPLSDSASDGKVDKVDEELDGPKHVEEAIGPVGTVVGIEMLLLISGNGGQGWDLLRAGRHRLLGVGLNGEDVYRDSDPEDKVAESKDHRDQWVERQEEHVMNGTTGLLEHFDSDPENGQRTM